MKIHNLEKRIRGGYTTFGSLWEKGEVKTDSDFTLWNEQKEEIPVQTRVTAYWPDGSVKWAAHTADSRKIGEQAEITPIKASIDSDSKKLNLEITDTEYLVKGEQISIVIPKQGSEVLKDLYIDGSLKVTKAVPVLLIERRESEGLERITRELTGIGKIHEVSIEEEGPLSMVFCVRGSHVISTKDLHYYNQEILPYILRIRICIDSNQLEFTHTFLYDGDEKRDFLKGIGVRFYCPMEGENYNRHVKFGTDHGVFHESLNLLLTWRPRIPEAIYQKQIDGILVNLSGESQELVTAAAKIPTWSNYHICQDSVSHFAIRKKVKEEGCCYLEGLHGYRAPGTAAFGGENGSLLFAMRDFWRKYPSGFTFQNMDADEMQATVWFWSPNAEPMDFRHYATEGYDQTYYEGFPEVGATPYGIANTNTFRLIGSEKIIPSDDEIKEFGESTDKPAVYIGSPEYYHEHRAFGFWSLPTKETAFETWLEEQLDAAIEFYIKEIDLRNWYGMFNYGDVMHTYDRFRHS